MGKRGSEIKARPRPRQVAIPDIEVLEKQISGALYCTIAAHGPITKDLIGSATKRAAAQVRIHMHRQVDEKAIMYHKGKRRR